MRLTPKLLGAAATALFATAWSPAEAVTISISCGAVGAELEYCQQGTKAWAEKTGNEVKIVSTPKSATERLALYQQLLAAGSADIDVFQIDVIWPGTLASHFIDLTDYVPEEEIALHFPAIIENNTVDGSLIGIPWFTDAGVLYYRKDLLEKYGKQPPTTWQEVTAIAKEIQAKEREAGNDKMWGYVFQGKADESLTCNAVEWLDSFGGGTIVDGEGAITINNPKAVEAMTWAATLVGEVSPEGVLNYAEEDSRGVWQSGNAVFMRNWAYAWPLGQAEGSAVKDKMAVMALPKGGPDGKTTAALGGWQLAVSTYSENQEAAAELVRYLTSKEEQKRRAIGGYNPTIPELYQDPDVLAAVPFYGELLDTFKSAVARPSRVTEAKYNQVSSEFFNTVHNILAKTAEPEPALAELASNLDRVSRGGRW